MSVVRTYIVWSPICYEERIWRLRDISGAHFMRHMNSACLVSIFIHHSQHFIGTVITQRVMHEIDGLPMVRPIGAHTDDGAIFMIQATFTFMALWQLQPLFTPNSFDILVIYLPT